MVATAVSSTISNTCADNSIGNIILVTLFPWFPINVINKWPAIMFAISRTERVIGRIMFLIVSIITMNIIKAGGVPNGTRWENIIMVELIHPYNIIANHIGKAILNVIKMWLVAVKMKGIKPNRLLVMMNIIKVSIIKEDPGLYVLDARVFDSEWIVFDSLLNSIFIFDWMIHFFCGNIKMIKIALIQFGRKDIEDVGSKDENKDVIIMFILYFGFCCYMLFLGFLYLFFY